MKKRLISLVSILALLLCLTACGKPSPTETVDTFLNGIKTGDTEAVNAIYAAEDFDVLAFAEGDSEDDELYSDLEEKLLAKVQDFDYTLSNEQIEEGKATVDVTFKTYNLGNAVSLWVSEYFAQALPLAFGGASDEQLQALADTILANKISEATEKTFEKTVTVALTEVDGVWIIDDLVDDDNFFNGITGGIVDAINNINSIYGE